MASPGPRARISSGWPVGSSKWTTTVEADVWHNVAYEVVSGTYLTGPKTGADLSIGFSCYYSNVLALHWSECAHEDCWAILPEYYIGREPGIVCAYNSN
jgi:hypothetical protein